MNLLHKAFTNSLVILGVAVLLAALAIFFQAPSVPTQQFVFWG